MATITIAADGTGDYTAPNASAYAALSTGTTANTVNWKPGVYRPTTGRWWGRTASRAMTKRCTHQVSGSGVVLLDARVYVPLVASDYVRWKSAYGLWRIELYTCVGGGTVDDITDVWFGAETGTSPSDLVMGAAYAPAATRAQCNADGLTIAGMATGAGIWYPATETSEVDGSSCQVIYVWCPQGEAVLPALQWGGIAACASQAGSPSAGTPRYGALCFARDSGASANDPTGSTIGPGFVVVAASKNLLGSTFATDADASLPVSDVHYDSVVMRGAGVNGLYLGSDQAGTVYSGWLLDGEWAYDDHRDPLTKPEFTDVNNRSAIYIAERGTAFTADGGTVTMGNTHAAIEVKGNGAAGEVRPSGCVFSDINISARTGTNDARWAGVGDADDTTIARCTVTGFSTRGQFGGTGTLLHGNRISGCTVGTIDNLNGTTPIRIRTGGDTTPASVTVKLYANVVDLRGTDPAYVWSAFDLIANSAQDIPANCIDARDNVALVETGQVVFRAQRQGSGTWSTAQNWRGGFTNAAAEAADGGTSSASIGSTSTLASLFATGTVVAPTADTAANILRRGDTPIRRPTVYGAAAAG